jgi:hypothetical protein
MPDWQEPEAKRPYPLTRAAGVSGLRSYSGYIREEFLPELVGQRGHKIYREMANNDSTCHAILFAVKMLLRASHWNVEPASEDADAVEAAELVEGMLFKDMEMGWPEVLDNACSMFTYGFSIQEAVFKKRNGVNTAKPWLSSDFDDGLYGIQGLFSRAQDTIPRWIFDDEGHLLGFEQYPWNDVHRVVPITRCLHYRTTSELQNPEGVSLLRGAYRSWYFLNNLEVIEGIGTERDLAGYPIIRVPGELLTATATPEQKAAASTYEAMLKNVRRDTQEGIMLPSDTREDGSKYYDFELLSSGGSRAIPISTSIERYQRNIARSILADFLFLGSDGAGSLALGETKVNTFVIAMKGYLEHFANQFNERLIPMIWQVNGLDPDLRPKLVPDDLEPEDLAAVAAYVNALATVGYDLASDTELENVLRRKAGLPDAPERPEEGVYDPGMTPEEEQAAVEATRSKREELHAEAANAAAEEDVRGKPPEKGKAEAEGKGGQKITVTVSKAWGEAVWEAFDE